ncbi:MAG: hypothetical protein PUC88_00650 [Clostridia bacterium]|nr:hypothetical protein [Clostridia bacterium]
MYTIEIFPGWIKEDGVIYTNDSAKQKAVSQGWKEVLVDEMPRYDANQFLQSYYTEDDNYIYKKWEIVSSNEDEEILHSINTIKVNGVEKEIVDKTVDICVPTKTSDLVNDSGFLTAHQDISGKVDKEEGKGLSQNDFSDQYKTQLDNLNVPTKTSELVNDSGYLSATRYTNTLVLITDFIEDSTFEDYPYRADISIESVRSEDYANISFALSDVQSKNYASICTTDDGKISIYAMEIPSADVTIPLIEVIKV